MEQKDIAYVYALVMLALRGRVGERKALELIGERAREIVERNRPKGKA